ncbi:MAG TPA: beta-L-arabinofuranosidase domain-containing protein [Puia sp.]|nr:beta-L-arabinofuranosidase domain-containing protein [Puia sp.]
MRKIVSPAIMVSALLFSHSSFAQNSLQQIEAVNFSQVQINDEFWKPRIDKIATATLPACIYQTEIATPRIQNFINAAKRKTGSFKGLVYDDSDVFKALEAISYSLKDNPDAALEKKADEWVDIIAAAQLPDGYLNTYYTLTDISKRWTQIPNHEDYNAGHLIEAAVAYYNATGKKKLLEVAERYANHIDSTFRLQNRHWISGHEEIELALVKLYHTTKNDRYLKLADWYLQQRGQKTAMGWFTPAYWQDIKPVKEQTKITGHAVRAMYLYTGAADVAAAIGDTGYLKAMKAVWEDVVDRNMYLTGGIGSSGDNEGFSKDYDLPNADAYCETCASVGMVLWNQRMNILTGDAKYVDVLERTLYNAALDGLSLTGDRFFYGNPLASVGKDTRGEWFGTACCPANIARLVASLGNYIYNRSDNDIWVNLFIGSKTNVQMGKSNIGIEQQTNYPWDGSVKINISPDKKTKMALHIRIPGWANGKAVAGDLYRFVNTETKKISLKINGNDAAYNLQKGYAVIDREWKKGDVVELNLPMEVKEVVANDSVSADAGKAALQRGPLVYCIEGSDNNKKAWNILLPADAKFNTDFQKNLLNGVTTISVELPVLTVSPDGRSILNEKKLVTAIPYYSWANRGGDDMQVWIPRTIKDVKINF